MYKSLYSPVSQHLVLFLPDWIHIFCIKALLADSRNLNIQLHFSFFFCLCENGKQNLLAYISRSQMITYGMGYIKTRKTKCWFCRHYRKPCKHLGNVFLWSQLKLKCSKRITLIFPEAYWIAIWSSKNILVIKPASKYFKILSLQYDKKKENG